MCHPFDCGESWSNPMLRASTRGAWTMMKDPLSDRGARYFRPCLGLATSGPNRPRQSTILGPRLLAAKLRANPYQRKCSAHNSTAWSACAARHSVKFALLITRAGSIMRFVRVRTGTKSELCSLITDRAKANADQIANPRWRPICCQ